MLGVRADSDNWGANGETSSEMVGKEGTEQKETISFWAD